MSERYFLLGDIHGNIRTIDKLYNRHKAVLSDNAEDNKIILLGDACFNYFIGVGKEETDHKVKTEFSKYPFTYICLRGNHESRVRDVIVEHPDRWFIKEKYAGTIYYEEEFPNIEYLEDSPAVYEFAGYKTLSLPGAYSVDKQRRLLEKDAWFENEMLNDDEMEYGRYLVGKYGTFDLIISHTCPFSAEPRDLFLMGINQNKVDKTMEYFLNEVEQTADYRRWAFGHFHEDRLYHYTAGKQMMMLGCSRLIDLRKFMEMRECDYWEEITCEQ